MLPPSRRSPSPFSWCHTVCRSGPQEGSSQPDFSSHHCMKKKWGWHTLPGTNREKRSKPYPPSYRQSSWLKVADGHPSSAELEPSMFLVRVMQNHCSPRPGLLQDPSHQQAGTYSTSMAILRSEVSFHPRVDSYTPYKSSEATKILRHSKLRHPSWRMKDPQGQCRSPAVYLPALGHYSGTRSWNSSPLLGTVHMFQPCSWNNQAKRCAQEYTYYIFTNETEVPVIKCVITCLFNNANLCLRHWTICLNSVMERLARSHQCINSFKYYSVNQSLND